MFQASLRTTAAAAARRSTNLISSRFCHQPLPASPQKATWRDLSSSSSRLLSESFDWRPSRTYSFGVSTRINCSFMRLNNTGLLLPSRRLSHDIIVSQQRRYLSSDEKKTATTANKKGVAEIEETGRLGRIVPALRQRVTDFNTNDLVSLYGIVLLIVAIVFAPFIANQMRKSDNTYDEIDSDDAVAQIESVYRSSELKEQQLQEQGMRKILREGGDPTATGRPKSVDNTVNMITDVLHSEALQAALASLISRVLDSDQFQQACQTLLKNLWNDLVNDPETTAQIVQLLQNAIQNKEIQRSVRKLVLQIVNDREVYDELTRLLVRLGQEKEVLEATQNLLTESTHNALNDPEILDHSMEFATDVVGDDIVQRTSGEALRNTVTYAVRPGISTFLSILGAGLLLFGLSAFANARASEYEAAIVEKALTTVARNISTTTAEGMGALLSLPGRLLSVCLSALTSIASFPVKLIQRGLSRMGRNGDAVVTAIASVIKYIGSLPGVCFRVVASSFGRAGGTISDSVSRAIHGTLATISASIVGVGYKSVVDVGQRGILVVGTGFSAYAQSFELLLLGTAKALEHSTVWIDTTINALAKTTHAAVDATMRSSETASKAIVTFVSNIMNSITNRGGGGSSATI